MFWAQDPGSRARRPHVTAARARHKLKFRSHNSRWANTNKYYVDTYITWLIHSRRRNTTTPFAPRKSKSTFNNSQNSLNMPPKPASTVASKGPASTVGGKAPAKSVEGAKAAKK